MRRIGACLLLIAAAACGGDSPTQPTPASVAGVWNLQTVNGSGLPFILAQLENDKVELTDDVLNVRERWVDRHRFPEREFAHRSRRRAGPHL